MGRKEEFRDFVLDQLRGLEEVDCKAMFGGYGLYHRGVFFGLLAREQLYFKTDPDSAADYRDRGMTCFQPSSRQKLKNYYEVPAEILEEADRLAEWARKAVDVALAQAGPKGKT
ncbi:MAG: competence protein TfoX [Nitrospinaceae bacterium]|nr:TfoX/Sxy family protein [Nitrospinaceae bacterium]NIS88075.1 TfoX/Sxy family protein [Nitrospinaceae bacterium]NIT84939.1 TfoX/Sxy family protein [Nitrospinaceae bacterium]NIU99316.1 competence protein TfoX [Nitrospinaceae bacterium]NIY18438.1 competence protein TfoX [Nitrospinaceae bacterium]